MGIPWDRLNFFDWMNWGRDYCPWLIVGKGPSFAPERVADFGFPFNVVGMNHVAREIPVYFSHIADYDIVDAYGEVIKRNAKFLIMPWNPYYKAQPTVETLETLSEKIPALKRMAKEERVLWYDTAGSRLQRGRGKYPTIRHRRYTTAGVVNLLAQAGVKTIRTLGIDGGITYANAFKDLEQTTLLANGELSFDKQFEDVAGVLFKTGVDFAPLGCDSPIRVYIGASRREALPAKVLEFSIRRRASITTEVVQMYEAAPPVRLPKRPENRPRTAFSFQRFQAPALAGYKGRAIYLDSDMLALQDFRWLWTAPMCGADALTVEQPYGVPHGNRPGVRSAMMLLDCNKVRWDIDLIVDALDAGETTYRDLLELRGIVDIKQQPLDRAWNSLEYHHPGKTAILHYTDLGTQPWAVEGNPLEHLWLDELRAAIEAGFITREFVEKEIEAGHVRPMLKEALCD